MKKLLTIILILALLLPGIALAADSDAVGCWVHYEKLTTGTPSCTMLYLAENHVCYFLIQAFHEDEPGLGRAFVGTWDWDSDGIVIAKTGNNTTTTLAFYPTYQVAIDKETGSIFVNLSVFDLE